MYEFTGGDTSKTIEVFVQDSSKTDGSGLTGLAYNTASLVASYVRPTAARAALSLATQTVTGAWSSGGFVEIDSSNMPGWYRLDVPDAALAAGVDHVGIELKGATNMAPCNVAILLKAVNFQDAVRAGLTALPNAAAEAAGGLYTRGSGAGQINQQTNGQVDTNLARWLNVAPLALSSQLVQAVSALTSGERTTLIAALLNTVNNGSTFNTNNSVGKQIRVAAGNVPVVLRTGTCQTGSTLTTIKLDSGAPAVNNVFLNAIVELTGGTGAGQTATIIGYNGTSKVCTVNKPWAITPDGTTTFSISGASSSLVSFEGQATAGGVNTVTLPSGASAVNDFYKGSWIAVIGGTGAGQTALLVDSYVGSTRVATMVANWATPPDNTSIVDVIPTGTTASDSIAVPSVADIVQGLLAQSLDETQTGATIHAAFNAARAQGFGKWSLVGTTLTLFASDGITVVKTFTLDDPNNPTSRT